MVFGRSAKTLQAASDALARDAPAAGWTWQQSAPPPSMEICEAVLRGRRRGGAPWTSGIQPVWPIGMADALAGTAEGQVFRAGRLRGYAYGTTNGGTVFGHLVETAAVWLPLPGPLPELRLVDSTGPQEDAGIRLPALDAVPPSHRWNAEGFIPDFARDLLRPAVVALLGAAPACSAIVIRAGVVLCYGIARWDAAVIADWVRILRGLIARVPAGSWGRADPLVAGHGVFPHELRDGDGLQLAERLVRRDWEGSGLSKFAWPDTPNLRGSVVLSGRESVEVQVFRRGEGPTGLVPGIEVTGPPSAAPSTIPTVASTLGRAS